MGCTNFWSKFGSAFAFLRFCVYQLDGAIIQYKCLNIYFDCKIILYVIVPGREGKYIFTKESFYLQGILNEINEQDTSFLDC